MHDLSEEIADCFQYATVIDSFVPVRSALEELLVDPAQITAARAPSPHYDATVVICDDDEIDQIPLTGLDQRFREIDVLGDGIVLGAA